MNRRLGKTAVLSIAGSCALLVVTVGVHPVRAQAPQVPRYEVDRFWPKLPLPDGWITGGMAGLCIDDRDHLIITNQQNVEPKDLRAARVAPPVIEFDPDGNVVRSWGDPKLLGDRLHDCRVDADQNVWVVGSLSGFIQKYSRDGRELLLQIGESGVYDSSDGTITGRPLNSNRAQFFLTAALDVDAETGDIYVADGETPGGNQRIAVLDRNGRFLRQWPLHRTAAERDLFQMPHCLRLAHDGLVYVCDRRADRIQVFDRMGKFIRNIDVPWQEHTPTGGRELRPRSRSGKLETDSRGTRGTAMALAFSPDRDQRLIFVLNQNSVRVDVLDRQTGQKLSSFGGGPGSYLGQFTLPHGIAVDSAGNVYVAEWGGQRIQKFRVVHP